MTAIGAKYVLLAALLVQASGSAAHAGDKARAKALLQEGLAFNRQGQHAQALAKFQAAYAAYPSPKLLFNIGQVQVELGHPLEAVQAFEDFLALVPDARPEDRKDASSALAQLGKKLGRLQIKCETVGAEISVDGKSVGRVPLPEPLWAMPGRHGVTIAQSGLVPATETVELGAGATALVAIRLLPAPPPAQVAPPAPAAAKPSLGPHPNPLPAAPGEGAGALASPRPAQRGEVASRSEEGEGPIAQSAAPAASAPSTLPPPAPPLAAPTALDLSTQSAPVQEPARPFYKTWWFWTGAGVIVAGAVTAAILLANPGGSNVPNTPLGNHGAFQ